VGRRPTNAIQVANTFAHRLLVISSGDVAHVPSMDLGVRQEWRRWSGSGGGVKKRPDAGRGE